jgi:hypothetical protein
MQRLPFLGPGLWCWNNNNNNSNNSNNNGNLPSNSQGQLSTRGGEGGRGRFDVWVVFAPNVQVTPVLNIYSPTTAHGRQRPKRQ